MKPSVDQPSSRAASRPWRLLWIAGVSLAVVWTALAGWSLALRLQTVPGTTPDLVQGVASGPETAGRPQGQGVAVLTHALVWLLGLGWLGGAVACLRRYRHTPPITAPDAMAEALRQSEQRYRLLFDAGTDGMAVADFATGILLDCNQAMLEIVGWEKSELLGKPQTVLHPADDRQGGASRSFRQHCETRQGEVLETTLITKTGELRRVEVRAAVLELDGRKVVHGVFRDVTERLEVESALRESEERYRLLFNGITDAVFVHGIRDDDLPGALLAVNDTLCQRLGYSRDELLRLTVLDIDAPESAVDRAAVVRKLRQGESVLFEQTHVTKAGRRIPVEIHVQVFQLRGRPLVLSVARDTTERKEAQRALVESEAQLRLVWEGSLDGMRLTDEAGIVRRVNQAYCRMMERPVEALEGQLLTAVYADDDQAALDAFRQRFRERTIEQHMERTMTLWNGKRISVDLSNAFLSVPGHPQMLLSVIRDVSARKRAEDALRRSEANLAAAQGIAHLGSWERGLADAADPQVKGLRWSAEVFRIFGYEPGQIAVSVEAFFRAVHPEDRDLVQATVREAVRERKPYRLDHRIVLPDGTERVVHEQAEVCVGTAPDEPLTLVGTVQDITEQTRAQQAQARLEAQLRQAQKMEAVGQLAGGVAHDFNNLLIVILGSADLLAQDAALTAESRELTRQITDTAARAAKLTQQLLAFSRKQVMQVHLLDLNEVLGQTLKMLRRVLGEHITLCCTYAPELPRVEADAGMLEQVVMNLAVNARDAMPNGGRLLVTTGICEVGPDQVRRNPEARAGCFVTLALGDTGCGMDEATQARLFEPFFTTKEVGKGTGLGLATVYGIVKQHGGWVEVGSAVSHGSTFTVYLPARAPAAAAAAPVGAVPPPAVAGGSETILLVEDDADVRRLLRHSLRRFGYRVLEAAHGLEALRVWEENEGQIDLLFTDIVMPAGMNGREVADLMLQRKPQLRVIFSSGYRGEAFGSVPQGPPGSHFLSKPYTVATLGRTVRACLDQGDPGGP
jgi:PAS domain S-box-containing protein